MVQKGDDLKMALEEMNNYRNLKDVHDQCKRYLDYHSTLTMTDGRVFDGIIVGVELDLIIVLVGEDMMEEDYEEPTDRQRPFDGFHRPRRRRFRRFRRHSFPLRDLAILSLLRYPYNSPAYPYYNDYYNDY